MLLASTSKLDSVAQFLTVLVLFAIVLLATWFTTKYIAGVQQGKMKGTNFEVIDSFRLSQNKYVQIMRIGERYLAVAVCKDTVTVLQELDKDEIVFLNQIDKEKNKSFGELLNKAKQGINKASKKATNQDDTEE